MPTLKPLLDDIRTRLIDEQTQRMRRAGHPALATAQSCILRYLDDQGVRMRDLAARNGMSKQAFGQHATHLEQRGYVERVPDPTDARAKLLRLTPKGVEHQRVAREVVDGIEAEWATRIGRGRMNDLCAMLNKLDSLLSEDRANEKAPPAA